MKRNDGVKVKIHWSILFKPKQIFYGFTGILDDFLWVSDKVGIVVMWILFILCSPIIALITLLIFPVRIVLFLKRVKQSPYELLCRQQRFGYYKIILSEVKKNETIDD